MFFTYNKPNSKISKKITKLNYQLTTIIYVKKIRIFVNLTKYIYKSAIGQNKMTRKTINNLN